MVERAVVLRMALARHPRKVSYERVALAVNESGQLAEQRAVDCRVPRQIPLVQQADAQLDIVIVQLRALGGCTHRLAHAQPGIPELLQEARDFALAPRR